MKCDKGHTPIEWDEKRLFCCPQCLSHDVHDRQREVIKRLEEALTNSQIALKGMMDKFIPRPKNNNLTGKSYDEKDIVQIYEKVENIQSNLKNGF